MQQIKVDIAPLDGESWYVVVTVKSGNRYIYRYIYSCLFNSQPTEAQVKRLWEDSHRKHWSRVG